MDDLEIAVRDACGHDWYDTNMGYHQNTKFDYSVYTRQPPAIQPLPYLPAVTIEDIFIPCKSPTMVLDFNDQ